MSDSLDNVQRQLEAARSGLGGPPLEQWNPRLSGTIDIRILADGSWLHEGTPIRREALVRLFASILRRENDGAYYLVTPVEKWRIAVDLHPLVVEDVEAVMEAGQATLLATCNTGRQVAIDADHPLFTEPAAAGAAVVSLEHGLTALFSRKAWPRLVNLAVDEDGETVIYSAGQRFPLA
ncbi:DUF1285 domain-containing protein [Pseudohaliea rubra]|uniref:Proteophosphoglycan n=1 Tax=Pseudohaliea rubra DSM 19751 TaxID=1265313 RepID=A0A095WY72_9GAMM|nr:DUF1285 domain-containing protein [Pseudohaliea rubra]KGE03569.1 Proteophosphoglycan precursor [Pseudohaliea rubra DSM 19751]